MKDFEFSITQVTNLNFQQTINAIAHLKKSLTSVVCIIAERD